MASVSVDIEQIVPNERLPLASVRLPQYTLVREELNRYRLDFIDGTHRVIEAANASDAAFWAQHDPPIVKMTWLNSLTPDTIPADRLQQAGMERALPLEASGEGGGPFVCNAMPQEEGHHFELLSLAGLDEHYGSFKAKKAAFAGVAQPHDHEA